MIGNHSDGTLAPDIAGHIEVRAPDGTVLREWDVPTGGYPILPTTEAIYFDWQVEYDPQADWWYCIAPVACPPGFYSLRTDQTRTGANASLTVQVKASSDAGIVERGETTYLLDDATVLDRLPPVGGGVTPWDIHRVGDGLGTGALMASNDPSGGEERGAHGWVVELDAADEGRAIIRCPDRDIAVSGAGYFLRTVDLYDDDAQVYAPFEVRERSGCGEGGGGAAPIRIHSSDWASIAGPGAFPTFASMDAAPLLNDAPVDDTATFYSHAMDPFTVPGLYHAVAFDFTEAVAQPYFTLMHRENNPSADPFAVSAFPGLTIWASDDGVTWFWISTIGVPDTFTRSWIKYDTSTIGWDVTGGTDADEGTSPHRFWGFVLSIAGNGFETAGAGEGIDIADARAYNVITRDRYVFAFG